MEINNTEMVNSATEYIAMLNHDCLAEILMHISILERLEMENVCQKWKEAAELSWYNVKKLDFNELMITLDKREETLKMLMIKYGRYLRHLTINKDQYPWMSRVLKDNCQNIVYFSIEISNNIYHKYEISNDDLVEIIGSMKKLKYLKVVKSRFRPFGLSLQILDKLPDDIHEIHLILEIIFREMNTTPVLERFKSLHRLTLHGFTLTNKTLEGILQNKNTLSKLDLSRCKFPSNTLSIFPNLKNLEHLNLNYVHDFNVNEIVSIAHNCSKLKHFEFYITKSGYRRKGLPYRIYHELKYLKLEHLNINNIDKSGYEGENLIAGLTNNWKQLKYLNVNEGREFSIADFEEITKLNDLQFVDLRFARVESEVFKNILNNCLELKELSVHRRKISKVILELPNLKKLEQLDFHHNHYLTDDFLSKIAINCKNLVDLDLSKCRNVTENSLIQVGKLQHLKKLNVSWIKNVPNAMFYNFRELEYVSCYCCSSITDEAIIKVLDNCQKLWHLVVRGTGITVRSLVHASKRKFVFEKLVMWVDDKYLQDSFIANTLTPSPYLIIC